LSVVQQYIVSNDVSIAERRVNVLVNSCDFVETQ
jgi:hypothetical protein